VPLWVVFELYNKCSIHNWHYIGLPESIPLRYFGYAWSFATIRSLKCRCQGIWVSRRSQSSAW
jgi:hypothetical protein